MRPHAASFVNRVYVTLVFAVILAIGGSGTVAVVRSQDSTEVLVHTFTHARDVNAMSTAVDDQESALLASFRADDPSLSSAFIDASKRFDAELRHAASEGWGNTMTLDALRAEHDAFLRGTGMLVRAIRAHRRAAAARIQQEDVMPHVEAMNRALDDAFTDAFDSTLASRDRERGIARRLVEMIVIVTALGLAVMTVVATTLRRYKRSADRAAADKLAALEQAALTDNLTGLGNHRAFYDDFAREVARAKRHGQSLTLALIDVDDFKTVNDRGGHAHGDGVLERVAAALRDFRREDRAYRVGGDEFALILVESDGDAAAVALGRLQSAVRDTPVGATLSIGYVSMPPHELDVASYELADAALYEAKRRGRNTIVAYAELPNTANVFSARAAEAVRKLIDERALTIAFQPIWDIRSTRPLGFEALARPHADLGLRGPQEAFDVAERMRKLPELDAVCVRKALEASADLPRGSVVFLNVSPVSLAHPTFEPQRFLAMLRAAHVRPQQIVVELTERRIDDPATVIERAAALRSYGVRVALDDTGSGHAGLEILSKLRLDFVKIDRSLIVEAIESPEARGVLAGVIAIARETGSYLIAEGIENTDMLEFVRTAHVSATPDFPGIRGVQGYLLGRPEIGRPDVRSLEAHHEILAGRTEEAQTAAA